MKTKIIFYSMYGHIYRMAEAVAEGEAEGEGEAVKSKGRKVRELVPA